MLLKRIIQEIKTKKELRDIDDGFIEARVKEYLDKNHISFEGDYEKLKRRLQFKKMFKEIRRKCRFVYGAFQDVKERRSLMVYKKIFEFTGDSILDIGCGEAPFEYCLLDKTKKYYLCDIDNKLVVRLNEFMKKNKINGKAFVFNAVDDGLDKLPKADSVFLLKALEGFEAVEKNISFRLLNGLKCKRVIASFSKIALGEKIAIRKSGRAWFRRVLKNLDYRYEIKDIDKEI